MMQLFEATKLKQKLNSLRPSLRLNVYGFNSSKFDIPVIAGLLFDVLTKRKIKINLMKKGARYFSVEFENIILLDTLNYTSPCSLSGFLQQFNVSEKKSVFPYQYFASIEDVKKCIEFPPYREFYSQLKQKNVPIEEYNEAKLLYEKCRLLPDGDTNQMKNMLDFLIYYNANDVMPLITAIKRCFSAYDSCFEQNAYTALSLPSLASAAAFHLYDKRAALCFSFNESNNDLRILFRESIIGGLVNVYHRRISLLDLSAPKNAVYSGTGEMFTKITFLDANR